MNELLAIERLVDRAQYWMSTTIMSGALSALEEGFPGAIRGAAHEVWAARDRSFIAEATPAQKAAFVAKMLFTDGVDLVSELDRAIDETRRAAREFEPSEHRVTEAIEIIFVGDLLYVEGLGSRTLSPMLRERLSGADLVVANLEGTVASSGNELKSIMTVDGAAQLLQFSRTHDRDWGSRFDESELLDFCSGLPRFAFNLANNHVLDDGREGLKSTMESLDRAGISSLGASKRASVLEVGETAIGFASLNFGHNHRVEDFEPNLRFGPLPYSIPEVAISREAARLEEAGADYRIAILHWGYEHEHVPRDEQIRCVERLWELGFDGIVGHHPHLLQPIVDQGGRWVAYSLGDFVGGDRTIFGRFSGALSLRLTAEGPLIEVLPVVQTSPFRTVHETRLVDEGTTFEKEVWRRLYRTRIDAPIVSTEA